MYNYIRAYVRYGNQWVFKDITGETLAYITANYSSFRIVLTWDVVTTEFEIHREDVKDIISTVDGTTTLTTWLASYTSNILPSRDEVSRLDSCKSVSFRDMHEYGFTETKRGNGNYAPDHVLAPGTDTDIMVSNNNEVLGEKSISNLGKNAIICCNGRMLKTFSANGYLYGKDAAFEAGKLGQELFSIIDFTDVGGCVKVDMNDTNVVELPRTQDMINNFTSSVVVDVGVSMRNRTPLASIDGYLFFNKVDITAISDTKVRINIRHDVVLTRASKRVHDELTWAKPANTQLSGLRADTFDVMELVKAATSFIILVETAELNVNVEPAGISGVNGFYVHYRSPKGMLISENGVLLPYYVNDFDKDMVSIAVGDVTKRRRLTAEFTNWSDSTIVTQAVYNDIVKQTVGANIVDMYTF